jgi:hypothetical protein
MTDLTPHTPVSAPGSRLMRSALARRLRGEPEVASEPTSAERPRFSALAQRLRAYSVAGDLVDDARGRLPLELPPSRSGVHAVQVDELPATQTKRHVG